MKKAISQNLKIYRILSLFILIVGSILLIYMIKVEGEPGALPLLLVFIGIGWLIKNEVQIKKQLQ